MHKRLFITLLGFIILLAGCDYSKEENQTGIFYNVFVKSMDGFLHFLGRVFQDNYGFAIISIVLIVLSLIHISEPTRLSLVSRMPSSA